MKETMTIHKALSELKILNSRIENEINDATFVFSNKHSNAKVNGRPVADFVGEIKDAYKSVNTLINRRNAIKRAVINSNAITKVVINGKEYTVAEAIDMKSNGLNLLSTLNDRMNRQFEQVSRTIERENGEKLDRRADDYIKATYENADMKNMSDDIRKVREVFVESQMYDMIDPLGIVKESKKLRDFIDGFYSEVDSALSVSNALTTIDVEYETM